MRKTVWASLLAGAVIVTLAGTAHAQRRDFSSGGVSQLGGQTLGRGSALATGGLYPGFWFQWTLGLSQRFDLGLRGDLLFASPVQTEYGPGFSFSVPMRLGLSRGQKVSVALKLAPTFVAGDFEDDAFGDSYCTYRPNLGWRCYDPADYRRLGDNEDFGVGFGFEFGVLIGIPVSIVNIIAGITSPFHLIFFEDHNGADVFIPIAPFGGAEVRVSERLNVFGMVQPGMTFHTNEYDSQMEGFFRFWAGIEYAL